MPKITKMLNFEITPAQFVRECDDTELLELSMELETALASRAKENKDRDHFLQLQGD